MTSVPSTNNGLQNVQEVASQDGQNATSSLPMAQVRASAQVMYTTCTVESLINRSLPEIPSEITQETLTSLNFRPAMGEAAAASDPQIWLRPCTNAWLGFQFWTTSRPIPSTAEAHSVPPQVIPHTRKMVQDWLREQCTNPEKRNLPDIVAEHCQFASAVAHSGVPANKVIDATTLQRFQFHPLPTQPQSGWYQKKLAENAYALWKEGFSLQEMSQVLPVAIPQPVPVSEPKPDGQVVQITLEPDTEVFTLPFHLCHRFLHNSQLSVMSQTHFAEEALTAMGLSSYSNISLSDITPDVLSDAGFSRSSENEQLWLKDQLEQSKYWVFNTGYPTMTGLLRWFMQIYQSEPNYELAQPSVILEAARRAINARQQAGLFSTATLHHTPSYLSGPATSSLSAYHSMDSHLGQRPSSAMPYHSSMQDHRSLYRSAERYHPARQEHHQVSAEVTLPADFIQAHRGSTDPITTAPIRIPVTIDLEINRPDPRDMQVRLYPQIEQRQELPFWVTPQMPHTPLPMQIAPQVSGTTMQVRPAIQQGLLPVIPSIAHTSMAVSPTISTGFMQVTPDIMQAGMAVQPAISTGLMPVTPDITDGRMLVSSIFTPTTLPLNAEFAPATFTVTPTFTQANLQIDPALRPAQLAITSTIEPTDLPIRPTWTPTTPVPAQLAIEPSTQTQAPRPETPSRAAPASMPVIRWPSFIPTSSLSLAAPPPLLRRNGSLSNRGHNPRNKGLDYLKGSHQAL